MADEQKEAEKAENGKAAERSINILGQYIKDLSFESPDAPNSILPGANPTIDIKLNVGAKAQEEHVFAVELNISASAERDGKKLFNVELVYGGVFRVEGFPENEMHPLLMIECPRLIFPFARQTISNVTQAGGFPPLMMEPFDFARVYRDNLRAAAEKIEADKKGEKPN